MAGRGAGKVVVKDVGKNGGKMVVNPTCFANGKNGKKSIQMS